jgi:hypothetical protein
MSEALKPTWLHVWLEYRGKVDQVIERNTTPGISGNPTMRTTLVEDTLPWTQF